jgi:glucose-1-phosphate adenylyltransferase
MRRGQEWFQGTADAVYQNINLIRQHSPDLVLVFGADHIYRMDIQQMVDFHLEKGAGATVAALPVPLQPSLRFRHHRRRCQWPHPRFPGKTGQPAGDAESTQSCLASMGNYLFDTQVLLNALESCNAAGGHDFGQNVLPSLLESGGLYAYDFSSNKVPGVRGYEEPAYWRDVGTLDAYFDAHMDVLGLEARFDAFNARWPIFSSNYQGPVANFIDAKVQRSIISAGCLINGASVKNSILRREVVLEPGAEVEDCIIMDYVVVRRAQDSSAPSSTATTKFPKMRASASTPPLTSHDTRSPTAASW